MEKQEYSSNTNQKTFMSRGSVTCILLANIKFCRKKITVGNYWIPIYFHKTANASQKLPCQHSEHTQCLNIQNKLSARTQEKTDKDDTFQTAPPNAVPSIVPVATNFPLNSSFRIINPCSGILAKIYIMPSSVLRLNTYDIKYVIV